MTWYPSDPLYTNAEKSKYLYWVPDFLLFSGVEMIILDSRDAHPRQSDGQEWTLSIRLSFRVESISSFHVPQLKVQM